MMTKLINKTFIFIVIGITLLSTSKLKAQADNIDTMIAEILDAWDTKFLDTSFYSYGSTEWFNSVIFNGGTKNFTKSMIYQFVFDQASALSSIVETHGLEVISEDGTSVPIETLLGMTSVLTFVTFTSASTAEILEMIDPFIESYEYFKIYVEYDDYYSDLDYEKKILLNYWFDAMKAHLKIVKVRVYNIALSAEEENEIINLAHELVEYYGEKTVEKTHIFNTIVQNVNKIENNSSSFKVRPGKKFYSSEILLYYFK